MRVIFINIIITASLIALVNLISNGLLAVYPQLEKINQNNKINNKSSYHQVYLPNYSDNKEHAKIHFQEKGMKRHLYEPYVGYRPKAFHGQSINIDSKGNRIHRNPNADLSNDKSVYFFGGSTIWGFGAWDDETIPALFSKISGMPTYNKGQEAYVSRQGLEQFITLLAQGEEIGVVIFYDGFNDVSVGCRVELKPNDHSRAQVFREIIESQPLNCGLVILEKIFLNGTKKLATKIHARIFQSDTPKQMDRSYLCDKSDERAQDVAATLVNNWEIAHDIAKARDIEFYAILHPTAHVGEAKTDHLQQYLSSVHQIELGKQLKVVYPLIKKIARERKHDWILDYTDAFSRNEYIYIGAVHTSGNGNHIIAERLSRDIVSNANKKGGPKAKPFSKGVEAE